MTLGVNLLSREGNSQTGLDHDGLDFSCRMLGHIAVVISLVLRRGVHRCRNGMSKPTSKTDSQVDIPSLRER